MRSRTIIAVAVLVGILLALGLCVGTILPPEDVTGDRTAGERSGDRPDGPGEGRGEATWEPASGTVDQGATADTAEPVREVTLLVRVQDGMTGGPADAQAVTMLAGHPTRRIPLRRIDTGFRVEGGVPRDGWLRLCVTPHPGFAPEALVLRFPGKIGDEVRTAVVTVVVWPTFRVRVEVRDRDGAPVPDVDLHACWPGWGSLPMASGRTGADGEGHLAAIPLVPDEWVVVRAHRGNAFASGVLEPEERRAVEVRVLDEEGRPVPSASISTEGPILVETTQFLGLRTDGSGRAVVPGIMRVRTLIHVVRGTSQTREWLLPVQDHLDVILHGARSRPLPYIQGTLTRVEGGLRISVGRNTGVTVGLRFSVAGTREGKKEWLGFLVIEKVGETWASGRWDPRPPDRQPRVGDVVWIEE